MDPTLERSISPDGPSGAAMLADVFCLRVRIANLCFVGDPEAGSDNQWLMIDAGLAHSADNIREAAAERFGAESKPAAIVLTHGHFDHVGAAHDLAAAWDIPIYAHRAEQPYLTGEADYPPPDVAAGGGMMTLLSPIYPRRAIDLSPHLQTLPDDGTIPGLPEWRWVHTPGHTPGHVSLFRERDGAMISGDAFITVKQESAIAVLTQTPEVHGPPAYFTSDWQAAWDSVRRLADLNPAWAATGHGHPMSGHALSRGLTDLAENFDHLAIPGHLRADMHGDPHRIH